MITKELKTITLYDIKLDVYYSLFADGYIQIESIDDVASTQNLMPIMNQDLFENVIDMIKEIEAKKG